MSTSIAMRLARVERKRRRMLQGELARKAGVGEKAIHRLKQGDNGASMGNLLSVH